MSRTVAAWSAILVLAQAAAAASPKAATPAPKSARQQRIETLLQRVERDPADVTSWVALGNEYFDSQQREKAIEAYAKALRLRPDDADVLTDQGILYREIGKRDQAIANFTRAGKVNPKHLQSALNLGILYAQDLKDEAKAMQQWDRVIELAPASAEAARARQYQTLVKQASAAR